MKTYRIYVLLAAVCVSAAAVISLLAYGDRAAVSSPSPKTGDPTAASTTSASTAATTAATGYVLSQWNGKLALFLAGHPYPEEVYDVYIRSFPAEDQQRLTEGITAANDAELEQLLEDYSG